jgi:hypothetical protein
MRVLTMRLVEQWAGGATTRTVVRWGGWTSEAHRAVQRSHRQERSTQSGYHHKQVRFSHPQPLYPNAEAEFRSI